MIAFGAVVAIASVAPLMYETGWTTWIQFAGFRAAGSLVYVLYGRRNSRLAQAGAGAEAATAPDAAGREPRAV